MAFKDIASLGLLTRQKTSVVCQMVQLGIKVKEGMNLTQDLCCQLFDIYVVLLYLTSILSLSENCTFAPNGRAG